MMVVVRVVVGVRCFVVGMLVRMADISTRMRMRVVLVIVAVRVGMRDLLV